MLRNINVVFLHHVFKFFYAFWVKLLQLIKHNTIANAMFGAQQITEAITYCMCHAYLAVGNAHATGIRCHHEFIIAVCIPTVFIYIHIPAKLQSFFAITFAELVQVSSVHANLKADDEDYVNEKNVK